MTHTQRYVSNELSHFVGKGRPEEEQYDILVNKILKPGWLTHPPHDVTGKPNVNIDDLKDISTSEMITPNVICFCDIPEIDLGIHVSKYSKFGLSFNKDFLISKGASPVFYVANEAPATAFLHGVIGNAQLMDKINEAYRRGCMDRATLFDAMVKGIFALVRGLEGLNPDERAWSFQYPTPDHFAKNKENLESILGVTDDELSALRNLLANPKVFATLKVCTEFLCYYVFSFVKCFNAKGSFEDETNYYMEREWRITGNLKFSLNDVRRIFLPANYAARLRIDLPSYIGQISFVD